MTAGGSRIEAAGRWLAGPDAAPRDVRVTVGASTLVIATAEGEALSHWSLPAVERLSSGPPARYGPGGSDAGDESVAVEDASLIGAIERVRREARRGRPRPWRRWIAPAAVLALLAAGAVWLPGMLRDYAVRVVPPEVRAALDATLLARMEALAGPACDDPAALAALGRLAERLAPGAPGGLARVVALPDGGGALLPGGTLVLPRAALAAEGPDVAAGHALALAAGEDPLAALLEDAGVAEAGRLLTSARVSGGALDAHAARLLMRPDPEPEAPALLARFAAAEVTAAPYAAAVARPDLADADPHPDMPPILSAADWEAVRAGCG